jgi:isopentenyl-diphosphate delta-isomerase
MSNEKGKISQRKDDHLAICAKEEVEARIKSTLLEEVELLHNSLPELDFNKIDISTQLFGKRLRAPLLISGMTGGVARAEVLNRALAEAAERHGIAIGLGSQRPMSADPSNRLGYHLRDVAPNTVIIGNIGAVQAAQMSLGEVEDLVGSVGADALALHLNPAQEIIQDDGDRDFQGLVDAIGRIHGALSVPIVIKETGCGLGPSALSRLRNVGVEWVDVAGAGGTTWIGVEAHRSKSERVHMGELLWDWGVPTAVSTVSAVRLGFNTIASGGLRTGLDAARAIALGARAAGMALPYLRAFEEGGAQAVDRLILQLVETIKATFLLTGSGDLNSFQNAPRVLGANLLRWLNQLDS